MRVQMSSLIASIKKKGSVLVSFDDNNFNNDAISL